MRFFPMPMRALALTLPVLLSLSSCSFYQVFTTAEVQTSFATDSVEISLEIRDAEEVESFEFLGYNFAEVTLDNYTEGHVLRAERVGYYPQNLPVFRERLNRWKGLDALLAFGFANTLAQHDADWEARQYAEAMGLTYNVLGWVASPWRVYGKSFQFDELEPMPKAAEHAPPVWIEGVHIAVAPGNHVTDHYRTRDAFYRNRKAFQFENDEAFAVDYTNLDEDALECLWEQGYQGPNGTSLFTQEDELVLEAAITHVHEEQIGNLAKYTIQTQWWVHNPYGLPTDTVTYRTYSPWGFASGYESPFDRQALADVIVRNALKAAENPLLQAEAARKDSLEAEWKSDWSPIVLPQVTKAAGSLSEALASVVTIEDDYGHGSGCILSSDGYILTNHHVVLDTTQQQTVHFQDGSKRKAELIRYHPLYDLALLKVDTTGLRPFQPDLRRDAMDVGDDVFAMGTPYDIALGASVTRGIVSSTRKDGKRSLIQTDVSISPGNSGGALVRQDGTLVGVVNEKIMELGVEGIGFAIPLHHIEEALMLRYASGR